MLGGILVFLIRDVTSCQRESKMPVLFSFQTDVRTTMIGIYVLNRGGKAVLGPADALVHRKPIGGQVLQYDIEW